MKKVKLYDLIGLSLEESSVISVVGGGGKTTLIEVLADELKSKGKRVLVAPSTAMALPPEYKYDNLFIGEILPEFLPESGSITYFAEYNDSIKIRTKDIGLIENIKSRNIFDYLLVEADGAKKKPIKAPGDHEPVILRCTEITVGVIGIDSLDMPIDEKHVHRAEIFKSRIGKSHGVIDEDAIVELVLNENGLFKSSLGRKILFLNKADSELKIKRGLGIKKKLKDKEISVFIGEIKTGNFI